MKFYNKKSELAELRRIRDLSFSLWGVKVKQRFVLNLFRLSANRLMYLFQWKYVPSGHYFSI